MNSASFKALEKLALSKVVKLYIPYIVEREFQTQQRDLYKTNLDKVMSGLNGLHRRALPEGVEDLVLKIKGEVSEHKDSILGFSEQQMCSWAEKLNAERLPLCLDQAVNSMEAYFKGEPPLKKVKAREDIPDSFLVQSINKIKKTIGNVYLVAGDKKVREAFKGVNEVSTFKDLSSFVESSFVQDELKILDLIDNLDEIEGALKGYDDLKRLASSAISNQLGEAIVYKVIKDPSIPDDNNEATIDSYSEAENIEIDTGELSYFGDFKFGFPFEATMFVQATYYIYKGDYYIMCEEGYSAHVSDHNSHYFEAEAEYEVLIRGTGVITLEPNYIDIYNISECVDYHGIEIDEVESIELC